VQNCFTYSKLLLLFFSLIIASSCTTRRDILIDLNKDLFNESVQVDFIGMTENDKVTFESYSFFQYWKFVGLKKRDHELETIINFLPFSYDFEKSISSKSSIWKEWSDKNCDYIFIAVDLPYNQTKKIVWKKIIYIQQYSWYNFWSNRDLYVYVDSEGLTLKSE
jgi:hypothetical protein